MKHNYYIRQLEKASILFFFLISVNFSYSRDILQVYKELDYRVSAQRELGKVYSAKIYGANALLLPEANYTPFNNKASSNTDTNPLSTMPLNYSSLKSDAMTNNSFTISNNQLYDVAIRSSPINSFYLNITSPKIYKL